jgi:GNAT superfamily N-acetyltransferase
VLADRLATWDQRLHERRPLRYTLLAEQDGLLVGFANTYLRDDARWGSLLDNLHVGAAHQRRGIGSRLLSLTAHEIVERSRGEGDGRGLYLWVLEQNVRGRAFYEALGASFAGSEPVTAPGGVAGRLHGDPLKLRYAWADAGALAAAAT